MKIFPARSKGIHEIMDTQIIPRCINVVAYLCFIFPLSPIHLLHGHPPFVCVCGGGGWPPYPEKEKGSCFRTVVISSVVTVISESILRMMLLEVAPSYHQTVKKKK